jgi:hypothetical protein
VNYPSDWEKKSIFHWFGWATPHFFALNWTPVQILSVGMFFGCKPHFGFTPSHISDQTDHIHSFATVDFTENSDQDFCLNHYDNL